MKNRSSCSQRRTLLLLWSRNSVNFRLRCSNLSTRRRRRHLLLHPHRLKRRRRRGHQGRKRREIRMPHLELNLGSMPHHQPQLRTLRNPLKQRLPRIRLTQLLHHLRLKLSLMSVKLRNHRTIRATNSNLSLKMEFRRVNVKERVLEIREETDHRSRRGSGSFRRTSISPISSRHSRRTIMASISLYPRDN